MHRAHFRFDWPSSLLVAVSLHGSVGCSAAPPGSAPSSDDDPMEPVSPGELPPGAGAGGTPVLDLGGNPGAIEACASAAYESELLPASILIVVDRSGTMACNPPPITATADCEASPTTADPSQPTKWQVLGDAVSGAVGELTTVSNLDLGVTFFNNNDECGVQSQPNVGLAPLTGAQVDSIRSSLATVAPRGGTPLVGATILAYNHLHQVALAPGNRFAVLITDGVDNCAERYTDLGITEDRFQLLEREMQDAVGVNIRTFVVGTPGSTGARGLLSRMAWIGGTAREGSCDHTSDEPAAGTECHFDMTRTTDFVADLADALQRIAGRSAMTCEFDVPTSTDGQALDTSSVNVDYFRGGSIAETDKVLLYRDDTLPCDAGAAGWQYTDENRKIRLCGGACEEVRLDTSAKVVVSVGCEQRIR